MNLAYIYQSRASVEQPSNLSALTWFWMYTFKFVLYFCTAVCLCSKHHINGFESGCVPFATREHIQVLIGLSRIDSTENKLIFPQFVLKNCHFLPTIVIFHMWYLETDASQHCTARAEHSTKESKHRKTEKELHDIKSAYFMPVKHINRIATAVASANEPFFFSVFVVVASFSQFPSPFSIGLLYRQANPE